MELLIEKIPNNRFAIVGMIQCGIYYAWFIYIFGFLGHVCPVAFLGMWTASLSFSIALTGRRPRFLGAFIGLLVTCIAWGLAFYIFHPMEFAVFINWEPFLILALTIPVLGLIQLIFSKGQPKVSSIFELKIEKIIAMISFLLTLVLGLTYIFVPQVKSMIWNDSPQEWFDTVFKVGDLYYLFYFIAIIALFSGFAMGMGVYFQKKGQQDRAIMAHLLGYTFLGMLFLGTWTTFVYLGIPCSKNSD